MTSMDSRRTLVCASYLTVTVFSGSLCCIQETVAADSNLTIERQDDRLVIRAGDNSIAHYVFRDPKIPRPYFAHVKTPRGTQATRTHPPREGTDAIDHATMHPGIWLAFGDLDGEDFWRNKASIRHVKFVEPPSVTNGTATFVEEKNYVAADGDGVCRERFHWKLHQLDHGFLMEWESRFTSDREFYFGDQEEMGLGIRVATPLTEKNGGLLRDSEGRKKAHQIWSNAARWCDYSGTINDRHVGMTLLCHPENFRNSWMHARNYGFMAANPFGRKAMHKGDTSKIVVRPGEALVLRYGIWIYESPERLKASECESIYQRYVQLSR